MNVAPLTSRPLGCLKATLRQTPLLCRSMATAVSTPSPKLPDHNFYQLRDTKTKKLRSAFAIYSPPIVYTKPDPTAPPPKKLPRNAPRPPAAKLPGLLVPPSDPLPLLHATQIARMDPTGARSAVVSKARHGAKPGDVLMVTHRRGGEPFAGTCMSIRRRGIDTAVLLRTHLGKVGVEMWYKIYNKNVAGVEIVKRAVKRARRARLTYLRLPKHDRGSVADLVHAWRKTRKVLTSKASGLAKKAEAKAAAKKAAAKKK